MFAPWWDSKFSRQPQKRTRETCCLYGRICWRGLEFTITPYINWKRHRDFPRFEIVRSFHRQPQKRIRETCCLIAWTNLLTWVGIYDHPVYKLKMSPGFFAVRSRDSRKFFHSCACLRLCVFICAGALGSSIKISPRTFFENVTTMCCDFKNVRSC